MQKTLLFLIVIFTNTVWVQILFLFTSLVRWRWNIIVLWLVECTKTAIKVFVSILGSLAGRLKSSVLDSCRYMIDGPVLNSPKTHKDIETYNLLVNLHSGIYPSHDIIMLLNSTLLFSCNNFSEGFSNSYFPKWFEALPAFKPVTCFTNIAIKLSCYSDGRSTLQYNSCDDKTS